VNLSPVAGRTLSHSFRQASTTQKGRAGATGDPARRKLLPGLFHLASAGFIPGCKIIAVALDNIHVTNLVARREKRSTSFFSQVAQTEWDTFAADLLYC